MIPNHLLTIAAFLFLPIGLVVAGGCKPANDQPEPELHRVGISRAAEAPGVAVAPPVVRVRPGDAIAWRSDDGEWSVELPDELQAVPLIVKGGPGETAVAHILSDADSGQYKYDALLTVNGRENRLDPLVIVEREEKPAAN